MSSDNGFILRMDELGKYVLQEYNASADDYPPIQKGTLVFDTVEAAVVKYEEISTGPFVLIEYGLTVRIKDITLPRADAQV